MAIKDKLAGAQRKLKTYAARAGQIRVRESDSGPTASAQTARVSVVIPVFNAMPYLKELLDSLAAQDMDPALFEVVAVDDGSTDDGGKLLDQYVAKHSNWRVIHQQNSGWPGKPRNVGITAGTSDYVFFCDADDKLGVEALRRMVAFADRHQVDVLAPRMVGIGGRRVQSSLFTETVPDVPVRKILGTLSPQKLIRRELLDTHGIRFPEGKVRLEDGMMLTRCYLASRRNAIAADYDYYFIRTRHDGTNISSQRAIPESYTGSVAEIARIIKENHDDADQAELLVLDLYRRKLLRTYVPSRYRSMPAGTRKRWVEAHAGFVEQYIPERLEAQLDFPFRQRSELVRARDAEGLLKLAATEEALKPTSRALLPQLDEEAVAFGLHFEPAATFESVRLVARGRGTAEARTFEARHDAGEYRAVLPRAELDGLGNVLVDLFVQLGLDGMEGPPRRILAPGEGLPVKSGGLRVYATVHGNLSLDQRR
ncbi:glycosyltransferase family 2 protein [Arthrobacter sulfonylureivorans]|uniref:Glycosyltransferase family 2 protein n=1 Tax=Arthrobacter sulfonylureivorans TaxID=2486855 RepID=A0ABY3W6G7_9MICC|nr:glycosyltransferase family A protein [Arthrobacter sulfonylureivorans]UNK45882.1 glycosyltransferase family 2 protein [Arthrobacter sulfonylureivorans]